jgi:hypothetical protein
MVGIDWYWDMMRVGLKKHKEGPAAQETIFGWVVSGSLKESPVNTYNHVNSTCLSHQLVCLNDIPENTLRKFWDLDAIGTSKNEENTTDPVLEKFEQTVVYKEGRYEVSLPWKENFKPEKLINNENLARRRLKNFSEIPTCN